MPQCTIWLLSIPENCLAHADFSEQNSLKTGLFLRPVTMSITGTDTVLQIAASGSSSVII